MCNNPYAINTYESKKEEFWSLYKKPVFYPDLLGEIPLPKKLKSPHKKFSSDNFKNVKYVIFAIFNLIQFKATIGHSLTMLVVKDLKM